MVNILWEEIGKVTHYYPKISVAVIELKAPLSIGEKILIKGVTTNFEQVVESMQIEHKDIQKAEVGQSVGIKVKEKVRKNDRVYRLI